MRLSVIFSFALVALAVSPLVACSQDTSEDDSAVTPGGDEESTEDELRSLSLTDADNGKTVTVTEGQNLVVKLSANPTTGYEWKVVSTDRTFGYPADTRFLKNSTGAVGSGGVERFSWKTKSPLSMVGEHTVKLEYKRPWETNASPAKKFEFTVKIVSGQCPELAPPAPGFCKGGTIKAKKDANGCTTGFECQTGCGGKTCGSGTSCQYCWGSLACIPNGAMC